MLTFYRGRIVKKSLFTTILIILCLLLSIKAFCQTNSDNFIKNFSTCTTFLNNGDNKIQIILGWSNRRCYYKEISIKEELKCGFKILELQEISKAMIEEKFDPINGLSTLNALQKYIPVSDTCTLKKKQASSKRR